MYSWTLLISIIIGSLTTRTEGAALCLSAVFRNSEDLWVFRLHKVPRRQQDSYDVTVYEQLEGGNLEEIYSETCKYPPREENIPFEIEDCKFQGNSKVVVAKVVYPDGVTLESNTVDLRSLEYQSAVSNVVGWVLGGIFIPVAIFCLCLVLFADCCPDVCKRKDRKPDVNE